MTYRVKWVEENLGVSRKALRNYERLGLLPANEDSQYREYNDSDIAHIWTIKQFQGMGYRLKEVALLLEADEDYIKDSLNKKIEEIELSIEEKTRLLNYAKMIRLTGRIPSLGTDDNYIPHEEFLEKSKMKWDASLLPDAYLTVVDKTVGRNEESFTDDDVDGLFGSLKDNGLDVEQSELLKAGLLDSALLDSIVKRSDLGPDHPEVQMLVRILFENLRDAFGDNEFEWDADSFVRIYTLTLIGGDMAQPNNDRLGKEACLFASNAIAIFCGYSNIAEAIEGI